MTRVCYGNHEKHCCIFRGVVCPYLEENTLPDRRWVCGLMREMGDWNKVLDSHAYRNRVQPLFDSVPELEGENCKDWFCPKEWCGDG